MGETEPPEAKPPEEPELAEPPIQGTNDLLVKAQEAAAQQVDVPPYDMMQNILLKEHLRKIGAPASGSLIEMEDHTSYDPTHIDEIKGPH